MSAIRLLGNPSLLGEVNKASIQKIEKNAEKKFDGVVGFGAVGFVQGLAISQHFDVPYIPILRPDEAVDGNCNYIKATDGQ